MSAKPEPTPEQDPQDWRAPLFARRGGGMKFDLESLRRVDAALGHPARAARHVQVLGTNGKGSTAAMIAWALQRGGKRVGLFTSPHLHRAGERVRVDFVPASDDQLRRALDEVLACESAAGRQLSFFELLTLASLVHFGRAGVDVVILEAGLGGRLDSTSCRRADLCVLTSIALDHQAWLGESLLEIAGEKLGGLRPGQLCLHAPLPKEVAPALAKARAMGVELVEVGPAARAPLPGEHQRFNASLALGALSILEPAAGHLDHDVFQGFSWPGRAERLRRDGGELLLDVAHNPASVQALVAWIMSSNTQVHALVFGAASDKDHESMLCALAKLRVPDNRFLRVQGVGPRAEVSQLPSAAAAQVHDQISTWLAQAPAPSCVLVCGSHFVVAPFRAWALNLKAVDIDPPELTDPVSARRSAP